MKLKGSYNFKLFTSVLNTIDKYKMHYSVTNKNVKVISYGLKPSTVKKVFIPRLFPKVKSKDNLKIQSKSIENSNAQEKELRINEINLQMLSRNIYKQIFKSNEYSKASDEVITKCLYELEKHGMKTQGLSYIPDVELKLPPLEGKNLEEHFKIIGEEQAKPYRELVIDLLKDIPPVPEKWLLKSGWTRYAPFEEPQTVTHPLEDAMVFDVEICLNAGKTPTLATAVSNKAWYGWVSEALIDGSSRPLANQHYALDDLIPLENSSNCDGYNLSPEFKVPRIVVGHNVSFDRSRVKEQYFFDKTGTRFLDTMSFHICVSGITSYQRAMLKSGKDIEEDDKWKLLSSLNSLSEVHNLYCGTVIDKATRDIFLEGTLADIKNDFDEVMEYCAGDVIATYDVLKVLFPMFLERFPHPVTLAGMLELGMAYLPVNGNWNKYINDCEQIYEDLNSEAKFLLARRADQACQLMHANKYKEDLWMWDQDWSTQDFKLKKSLIKLRKKENEVSEENETVKDSKKRRTRRVKNQDIEVVGNQNIADNKNAIEIQLMAGNINERIISTKNDILLEDTETDLLEMMFSHLFETKNLPVRVQHLPGYPAWYRKLCNKPILDENWIPGPHLLSTSMQVTPKLLGLTWEGYPLHYMREKGWGFLIPHSDNDTKTQIPIKQLIEKYPPTIIKQKEGTILEDSFQKQLEINLTKNEWWRSKKRKDKSEGIYKGTGVWCNINLDDCCWFLKLPHKDGVSNNVGNPLARDFLNKFSDNVLAGDSESAEKVLLIARMLSYWRNNRDRIMEQIVVWLKTSHLPSNMQVDKYQYGVILPQVVVCGTLTRRAMEPTWMTASNAHKERVGSELRAMIQAPPEYSIVGADVDSQELWIASILGDSVQAKIHGGTPLGWMTLIGSKSNGTDMHSVTANVVGISRDHAKIINYARIYGAGQNFAERLLKQFNPSMSETEAKNKALKMFAITKGKRLFTLKPEYVNDFDNRPYSMYQAFEICKACGKTIDDLFLKPKWTGGSESAMFNRLEEIAGQPSPVTPFLEGRLSRALESNNTLKDDRFLPTKVNWVVQSGAVDFLHLMLVSMRWLMKDQIRFCLSFHDEVRYLVPDNLKYDAALAMHITNLLTRSFCSIRLGINDLPMSVAFFSSVEIDRVLRKESHLDCKTPSNPHGLEKGYKIKNGESLTIQECINKTGGEISLWKKGNTVR